MSSSESGTYALDLVGTGLLLAAALGLWASLATTTGRCLSIPARARAAEKGLAAVTATLVSAIISVNIIWRAALESSVTLLLLGIAGLAAWAVVATLQVQRVIRKGRRLRAASGQAG